MISVLNRRLDVGEGRERVLKSRVDLLQGRLTQVRINHRVQRQCRSRHHTHTAHVRCSGGRHLCPGRRSRWPSQQPFCNVFVNQFMPLFTDIALRLSQLNFSSKPLDPRSATNGSGARSGRLGAEASGGGADRPSLKLPAMRRGEDVVQVGLTSLVYVM